MDAGQFGRVACPECGRIVAVRRHGGFETTGTLYRHQKALGQTSRLWRDRARADEVRRNEWRHYHNQDLVVRLWFTHFGGEEAFEAFSRDVRQADVTRRIDEHFESCAACRAYLRDLEGLTEKCPVLAGLHDEYDALV